MKKIPPANRPHANPPVAAASAVPTVAFFSYARSDDEHTRGVVSAIRKEIEDAVSFHNGARLTVFQDTEDIEGGEHWRKALEKALAEATIFVPLITPAFFNSEHCRDELSRFLARDDAGTLVLPIHFVDTDFATSEARDELIAAIEERQWLDWRRHQRQTRINRLLREDIHAAAQRILKCWRAARPTSEAQAAIAPAPRRRASHPDHREVPSPRITKPAWAYGIGDDRFGPWSEIAVERDKGEPVIQRLRWIPQGRFMMGSPDDEPERLSWEGPRHTVTLPEGFWLFDTACT
ncbi:MAG: TIR domain-containing protein [Nitrococcus sp.]|nr:TIR domain-containing protein [Nitrococcus sp.]